MKPTESSKTQEIHPLLEVAASTASVLPWGVAVPKSIDRLFLWDTRPGASRSIIEAIASEDGAVYESGAVNTAAVS